MENKRVFEQVAWSKESLLKWWDLYRSGGTFAHRADQDKLKAYVLIRNMTGNPTAWVLLHDKTPDQIRDPHLVYDNAEKHAERYGWTAKELTYEEAKTE